MRYRSLAGLAILVVAAFAVTTACTSTGGQGGQALGPAPAFELPTLTGQRLASESLKGKPTLLSFGASW